MRTLIVNRAHRCCIALAVAVAFTTCGATGQGLLEQKMAAEDGSQYGFSVCVLGDIDGDGNRDYAVGAYGANESAGYAAAYSGRTGALIQEWFGNAPSDEFGWSACGAGDVNGDGVPDIAVGAPQTFASDGKGYVRIFSGADGSLLSETTGTVVGARHGYALALLGDLNGGGSRELAIGAPGENSGAGAVLILSGSGMKRSVMLVEPGLLGLGIALCDAGDTDHDGKDELLAGTASNEAILFSGRSIDAGAQFIVRELFAPAPSSVPGGVLPVFYGTSMAWAGDWNGDGTDDVAVGDYYALVFTAAGVLGRAGLVEIRSGADGSVLAQFLGDAPNAQFGTALRAVNVDGHRRPELLISSPGHNNAAGVLSVGLIRVFSAYYGELYCIEGSAEGDMLGWGTNIANLGDITGDGDEDFAVGVPHPVDGAGSVLVFSGGPWTDLGHALAGASGTPTLAGDGATVPGGGIEIVLQNAAPDAVGLLVIGANAINVPFKGGVLVPQTDVLVAMTHIGANGSVVIHANWPAVPAGSVLYLQVWLPEEEVPYGYSASNVLSVIGWK